MSFTTYKIIHIFSLLLMSACLSVSFLCSYSEKWIKMASGIVSLVMVVTGFGLLAKLGFHGIDYPLWIWIKLAVWLVIAVAAPILAKRLTQHRALVFFGFMGLFLIALIVTILKP